jgi:CheY-like chemotaxis protein
LSISLGIISEHGGRIWAENIPSGGSRFCVELPLVAPEEVPAPPTDAAGAEPAKGLRVLVADDEPPLRAALGRLLARAGHDVVSVGSGNEALAQAALDVFDAILLDIRMPDISGKDVFLRWQAERPDLAERVVFLTGDIVSADLQQFLIASGRPYVPKPFEFSAVLKVLPHR